ncbi:MAG: CinA family nicotinamide mononucleotide deamidase-related protein [Desulfobacteraceae bacterium]|nr:MAG: CinA family nicotinamide mononucleotide deamidase-related protein [Desulfobacteraceae bacterium]
MIAEILSTGDEVRSGALVDSNSAHIAEVLEEAGLEVTRHSTVGDDRAAISSIIKEIGARADVAVVTGGLGPTTDDLTAEAAAKAAGTKLYEDEKALFSMENFFRNRQRLMNPLNKKQAMLPEGSKCLENSVGSAPGFAVRIENCLFFFLPGVPSEMKKMLSEKVIPEIFALQGGVREYSLIRSISTFGLTEAAVNENLLNVIGDYPGIKLGLRATFPEIHVKLYARGRDEKTVSELLERATESVINKLGKRVLSSKGEPMELVVGNILKTKKATLAVAESCTGGLVSNMLTNVPGSSDYFLFSGVTYSNDSKTKMLGVQQAIIEKYGAVHEETAKEMAVCARRIGGATYGLSTSGIAGPAGGTEEKPVGTICIGIATSEEAKGFRFNFQFGDRLMNKKVFAVTALDLLRKELLK